MAGQKTKSNMLPTPVILREKACANCSSWSELDVTERSPGSEGECRRYPPKVLQMSDDDGMLTYWPLTAADEWCGEHRREMND